MWLLSQPPTPKFYHFSPNATHDFVHFVANILNIPTIFVFCGVCAVIHNSQVLFDGNTVLPYLSMDQPLKIYVKEMWQKRVSLVCTDSWKSDLAAFFQLKPGISMTFRHPANWKIWSPFVPPDDTKFHSGPRTIDNNLLIGRTNVATSSRVSEPWWYDVNFPYRRELF